MIGIVVVTHGTIGTEMVAAVRRIIPEAKNLVGVTVAFDEPTATTHAAVHKAMKQVHKSSGVLLLTDMFGGTPSNVCLSFLSERNVEMVSGVNLPMLVKLVTLRNRMSVAELAQFIQEYGRRNIVVARQRTFGREEAA